MKKALKFGLVAIGTIIGIAGVLMSTEDDSDDETEVIDSDDVEVVDQV